MNIAIWLEANSTDPRAIRIMKANARPLTTNNNLGKLIGELMRELEKEAA